jgi:hypothetical protein
MGSVTKEEYESLLARKSRARQQPERQAGELLAIFVPGRLVNPLNAHAWGWRKRSRTAKAWKERVAVALLEDDWGRVALRFGPAPAPKAVHFHAHVFNRFDGDGLQAACKPIRDALVECGVISGDADRDGHSFTYSQQIDRKNRGVTIRVRLSPHAEREGG